MSFLWCGIIQSDQLILPRGELSWIEIDSSVYDADSMLLLLIFDTRSSPFFYIRLQ